MSALTFELRSAPDQRLDLAPLTPKRLGGLKAKEIEAIAIGTTRAPLTVGDAFTVKGKDAAELRFVGTDGRCDKIGADLTEGAIVVEGDAGAYLGAGMKKGKIEVNGNAGVLAGASMAGGAIAISGNAGERAGGINVGETLGMKGGVLTMPDRCLASACGGGSWSSPATPATMPADAWSPEPFSSSGEWAPMPVTACAAGA